MDEQSPRGSAAEPEVSPARPEPAPTGHPAVDEVLRSLRDLEHLPTGEHVAVFERAHERLRRALDEARQDAQTAAPRPAE